MLNKMKKIPLRSCIVTKEQLPKYELIRVVRTTDGEVKIDLTSKLNGRGAYIKKDISVIEEAEKKKILNRHLNVDVKEEIYEELKKLC